MPTNPDRDKAIKRLGLLIGTAETEAGSLVDAAIAGATDHALELIVGSGPVPTSLTATRADQLRFVCKRAGRLLTQREVEILFRVTSAAARSILTTMLATYEESLRDQFLVRMRTDATVTASGSDDAGLEWTLRFTESNTHAAAVTEAKRNGLGKSLVEEPTRRTLTVPRVISVDGKTVDVLKALGIEAPA